MEEGDKVYVSKEFNGYEFVIKNLINNYKERR